MTLAGPFRDDTTRPAEVNFVTTAADAMHVWSLPSGVCSAQFCILEKYKIHSVTFSVFFPATLSVFFLAYNQTNRIAIQSSAVFGKRIILVNILLFCGKQSRVEVYRLAHFFLFSR